MKTPAHIVVMRLSALGDVAMTVPVILKLISTYPEVTITIVSRKLFKPLFVGIPRVAFMEADVKGKHKGLLGIVKLSKEIRRMDITAVADLHNVIRSKVMTRYLKSISIKIATLDKGRPEKMELIKSSAKHLQPLKSTHERYADVFRKLGFALKLNPPQFLNQLPVPSKITYDTSKKHIGIAPFAAYKSKMYPLKLMQEVLLTLGKETNYQIFLFGSVEEKKKLDDLASGIKGINNVAGIFSLEEELALISNLNLMVSMDSANGHLAAMFGIPVITLWGVTHPYTGFVPFNQPMDYQLLSDNEKYPLLPTSVYGNKYPKGYEGVMESIQPITVINKIEEILSTTP